MNADAGATLTKWVMPEHLRHAQGGDVIIVGMNEPISDAAEGLAVGLTKLSRRGLALVRPDQVNLTDVQPRLETQSDPAG